jgi:hypothetical protein
MRSFFVIVRFVIVPAICFILFSSFNVNVGGDVFSVNQPDYNRLNTAIIEFINAKRAKKSGVNLESNDALQKTALYFTQTLRLTKFERLMNERRILKRKVSVQSWKNGYTNTMVDVNITFTEAIHFKGGDFYYDRSDTETNSHIFYGKKPGKKEKEEEGFKLRPVKDYTYEELAEQIAQDFLKDNRSSKALNEGYTNIGCSCSLEKNTVNRTRIPLLKAVFVLGGKRINF